MGAITRIRQLSPYFLAVVAVLFIVFMVLQDSSCSTIRQQGKSPEATPVAEVNGDTFSQAEYEQRVKEYLENLRAQNARLEQQGQQPQEIDETQVRQQIFDQMVDELLLNQIAKQLGVKVTDDELYDAIVVNPPAELQFFKDSTGKFMKSMYQELVTNPAKYGEMLAQQGAPPDQVEKQQKLWDQTLRDIETNMRRQKVMDLVSSTVGAAASIASPTYTELDYKTNNSTADIRFVAIPTDHIRDSTIAVSDNEVSAYYEANKQYYVQKPERKIKYVIFREQPSNKDSARAQKRSAELMQVFSSVTDSLKRDSIFTEKMAAFGGETHDFTLISNLDPNTSMVLRGLPVHGVFGPLTTPNGISYYRLDDKRESAEPTVRASHILIPFESSKDSALAKANEILAKARKGEDFAMLATLNSKDPGSAQQGGDLGYFSKGRMVPEFEKAAFGAEVGSVVGPVETQFGYHIIKVTDKQSLELKYSEIVIKPLISTATKQLIISSSVKMQQEIEEGKSIDSSAKSLGMTAAESKFFASRTPVLNSYELTAWAYQADKGEVTRIDVDRVGLVVAQLTEVRTTGTRSLEDMKEIIVRTLRQAKKLDMVKAKAEQVASACKSANSLDAALTVDSSFTVRTQTALRDNGQLTGFAGEYGITNQAFKLASGQISDAIRGRRAWFVMVVDGRVDADMNAYKKDKLAHLQNIAAKGRQNSYYTWFSTYKENATIVDKRWVRE
ncbi:MAG: peptidylprolyl isomerase [Bradyrhizobiaceae bacterium]|nr:peptidylprolyl isomerase [Bradyrhizobiaceae bacterium]